MEIEFKFALPAEQSDALQQAMQQGDWHSVPLVAHYFDTADGSLAASKAALRVRREGDRWVQTAKAIDLQRGPIVRLEHNVDLGPVQGDAVPQPDWRLHAEAPVGELLARALGDAPLQPTYGTDITRVVQRLRQGDSEIELALDMGQIVARQADGQSASLPVHELEMELLSGQVADLGAVAADWVARHGLWLDTRSKAERGEQLMRGAPAWPVVKAQAVVLGSDAGKKAKARDAGWAVQAAALGNCLHQLLPNLQALCAGVGEAEHVHQARVAMRRLRVALRELAALAPDDTTTWTAHSAALQAAFAQLGQVRDVQVSAEQPGLQRALAAHGLTPAKARAASEHAQALVAAARGTALQQSLVALLVHVAKPQPMGKTWSAKATRKHLAARLQRQHRQLVKAAAQWASLSADERHALRKRAKRLRYLAEFAWPLMTEHAGTTRAASRYLRRLARLQEALGAYNDALVAQSQKSSGGKPSAANWFSRGYWSAQADALAQACEKPLQRLTKAQVFWH